MREDEEKASRGALRQSIPFGREGYSYFCQLFTTNSATFVRLATKASSGGGTTGTNTIPNASRFRFVYSILVIDHDQQYGNIALVML